MRKKQVWRYYCEFCKKSGCSGGHMKTHEASCTANPNRVCRMCHSNIPPTEHSGILHRPGTTLEDWQAKMEALREATENCPACILAAIRQSGVQKYDPPAEPMDGGYIDPYAPMFWNGMGAEDKMLGFDFKAEKTAYLAERQKERYENTSFYC